MSGRTRFAIAATLGALGLALVVGPGPGPDLSPVARLHGSGKDIDSVAFWSDGTPGGLWLFVTAQANHRVEVWRHLLDRRESSPLLFDEGLTINGVAVDSESDRLYVTSGVEGSGRFEVNVFSLPDLVLLYHFGLGVLGEGEANLGIMHGPEGETRIFVTDNHRVHIFRETSESNSGVLSAEWIGAFAPPVSEIETVMADDYTQLVYVPEERGNAGLRPGVHVFDADGIPHLRNGSNVFGSDGHFDSDAEGIALYRCLDREGRDTGSGLIVVSDQTPRFTDLEFFDRVSWRHLGTLNVAGLAGTDGLAVIEKPLPGHSRGLLAAVHDDEHTVLMDWVEILEALSYECALVGDAGIEPATSAV